MMATIPVVDVPYEKLARLYFRTQHTRICLRALMYAEWLVDRRVCDSDWSLRLKALGSRVAAAIVLVQEQEHFKSYEAVRNILTQQNGGNHRIHFFTFLVL